MSIQYLRGFAAVLVLVYHIGHIMPETGVRFSLGAIGVDIFFVISGFIIWVTGRDLNPGPFLKRRLIRLVPLYWTITLVLALVTLTNGGGVDWTRLLHSLAFLAQPTDGVSLWPRPIITVGWTLNLEMLFYLCTAAALFAPRRARFAILAAVLGGLVALGFLLPAGTDPRLLFYTGSLMGEFLIGICLGVLWTTNKMPHFNITNVVLFTGAVVLLGFLPLEHANRLLSYGTFVALLVTLLLMAEPALRVRPVRLLNVLGDASYSLYLTHVPVILVCKSLSGSGIFPITGLALALVVAGVTIALSFACYYGFERPVHRALSARFRHQNPATTSAPVTP
ncbi:MAG: acyltransferase [Paracoccaceae bacterium]